MGREGENEGRGFKVVDRRRFTTDGDERSGPDVKKDAPAPKAEAAPPPAQETARPPKAEEPPGAEDAPKAADDGMPKSDQQITFSMFVQSMAQQALMQVGAIPHPATGRPEVHLEGARDTIDMLEMLREKTKGNLDPREKQLLDGVIYELRMTWVEVNNQLAQMAKEQPGGAPKG